MAKTSYTIKVLRDECIGDGACCDDAPNTFELDGEGKAVCMSTSDADEEVLNAAKACPTNAIVLTNAAGKQVWPED